ncbi:energy transducer TonB [Flavobacteriaceae bacterium]|nr:energy transducer TonB [Flavobacteriaceae bacterium]
MKKYLNLFCASILISILLTNSVNSANGLNLENKQENIVKFSEVEEVPLYPDCITLNFTKDKMRECTNEAIKMFASSSFNTELSNDLGLTGYQRITSSFIIDKKGQIVNIRVRAPHPQLKDEAIRVINLLPKMKPGKVNGKAVSVSYLLPIIFKAKPIKTDNDSISNSEDNVPVLNVITGNKVEVPISVIENVPIFPGCDKGNNTERRMCMSRKITKLVQKNFKVKLSSELGLLGMQRIRVIFKINKNGDVTNVRARAPHPKLKAEAIRVVNMLPKMKPGIHKGKAVVVPYSLPINFVVQK